MVGRHKKKKLINAPSDQFFWVHEGLTVENLKGLFEACESLISDEQFKYHVTKEKNDFADWTHDVLKDKTCANALRRAKKRKTAAKTIQKCLDAYSHT